MAKQADIMDKIVALCRRRGFIFGSSEIYGGIGGFWDYGPLGVELKRNIKDVWWNDMVRNPPIGPDGKTFQMVGVDCSIIMNPKVWEASGHVGGFSDPMVDCRECKGRFRADQLWIRRIGTSSPPPASAWNTLQYSSTPASGDEEAREALGTEVSKTLQKKADGMEAHVLFDEFLSLWRQAQQQSAPADLPPHIANISSTNGGIATLEGDWIARIPCPECKKTKSLTEPREFNLMFETYVGALQDSTSKAYLRPETAQGIFANFKNVMDSSRVKLPFGIAQIGKSFRNEINPRNFTFRSREFEQMEIEFFCHESQSQMWYEFWRDLRFKWYTDLGLKSDKLQLRDHDPDELAHYARGCADVEYAFPFGVAELEGIANRTDFDLKAHGKAAKGKEMAFAVVDDATKERFVPYVIEPSAGADRFTLAVLCEAYTFDENRASPEFMKFNPRLAPIKAAVFPLVAKDGMPEIAEPIYQEIKKSFPCQYDAKQSIGKRYARMDEAGTPYCFTIDGQSKEDGTVTVRNRDDASQDRIDKSRCLEFLRDKLGL